MRTSSSVYKMVTALDNAWYEWRVLQDDNVYGLDSLKSISVSYALTSGSGISIGNANSAECTMTLLEESANWARMARFTIQFRACLGNSGTKSEWITLGSFYTDERSEDTYGNLSIIAFDGMLKMEQSWTDKIPEQLLPASYPITARAWATMIQSANLATFEDVTQLDDTVTFVGLDTTSTIRDVLKTIAAVHGGNWVVTPSETLKFIKFENVSSDQGSKYTKLGTALHTFETSPALTAVSGVHLETEAGTVMESGDETGYVVKAICDVSDTSGIADLCLSNIDGYVFIPFDAGTAYLNPVTEIGDSVQISGSIYQIMLIDWEIMKLPTATISAPYDQEIDHEYMPVSQEAKNYRKTMAMVDDKMGDYVPWTEMSTAITQNAESVVIAAQGTYVTQIEYNEQIREIQSQLDGSIQTWSGNVVPTLNNSPAVDWNTAALRAEHVGDTYFVNSDAGIPQAGQYYRFENNNGTYSWQLLTDSALTEALAQAAAAQAAAATAQNTANASMTEAQAKGRIFVVKPTPPYDVGDLWFNSTQSVIKVCMTARASGSFVDSDWVKRDMYTDDSALESFINDYNLTIDAIRSQVDQKAETYYQSSDPATEWGGCVAGIAVAGIDVVGIPSSIAEAHVGDLWYRTTDSTTWFWDGVVWVQQDIPDEVFDMIDGKAQIFVSQPTTDQEYAIGDLWVNATYGTQYSNDVLRCQTPKAAGQAFSINHWAKASKYTDDSALSTFVDSVYNPEIAAIQTDLDGKVDTYFYNYAPTLSNAPANTWTTTAEKNNHVDDLFYNTTTGYTYRFTKSGSTFSWARIKDSDITTAMSTASTAKDTADGKRRVFVSQPTAAQAYDIGDLWANATYGSTYSNDLLKCKIAKAAGAAFNISHWEKASKYTDDSSLNSFVTRYETEFNVQTSSINAKVSKTSPTGQTSFSWAMNDTSHAWSANGNEVMKVNSSGLTVKGNITATAGYIGGTTGFTINATSIYNGMTSLGDTTHDGVYVGTNGIALGKGNFKVTSGGEITSKRGNIGGFTITASSLYNGMTSISDTTHDGVYIGTDGIALGKGKFKVTSAGAITATSGKIGGFNITSSSLYNGMTSFSDTTHDGVYIGTNGVSIGKGNFQVTPQGDLYANNGYFLGLVQAGSIMSEASDPGYGFGYFDGQGIEEYTVSGGVGGQLGYTNHGGVIGANMEYSTISDAYTDYGINTSLGYANYANGVFSGVTRANYVMASYVSAADQLIVGGYDVMWQYSSTLGGYVLMRSTN